MIITRLYVKNFRNIKEQEFEFHKGINIFTGNNGQGKTNLMEAISVCIGESFRKTRFQQYIPFEMENTDFVKIKLWFTDENYSNRENIIEYTISNKKRDIKYNGISVFDAKELYGVLKYVVFIPEHINIVRGQPELRRDYLDEVAFMQTPLHWKKLSRYQQALKQKNNILSSGMDKAELSAMVEPWNEILAQEGINVTYGRLKYFDFLKENAAEQYQKLTNDREKLDLTYTSTVFNTESIDFTDINALFNKYMDELRLSFEKETKLGYTVCGVHRDDITFSINESNARDFGSQGQVRSIALTLKLSEAALIQSRGNRPVIILDDVLSELDEQRRDFILNNISDSQIFITCCNIEDVKSLNAGKVWHTEKGEFHEL